MQHLDLEAMDVSDDEPGDSSLISDWSLRQPHANDVLLRGAFMTVLAESANSPPEEKVSPPACLPTIGRARCA